MAASSLENQLPKNVSIAWASGVLKLTCPAVASAPKNLNEQQLPPHFQDKHFGWQ